MRNDVTCEDARAAAVRRYVEAYRENPETPGEFTAARTVAKRALTTLP